MSIGYLSQIVSGKLFLEKIPWCYSRSNTCDANLVFCSCVLDAEMKTCEKTEGALLIKCLSMNKQLYNEIRSENLITCNFAKMGNVWASYWAKLIICIALFCSKFVRCLGFRFWPHAVHTYKRWKWKIA